MNLFFCGYNIFLEDVFIIYVYGIVFNVLILSFYLFVVKILGFGKVI